MLGVQRSGHDEDQNTRVPPPSTIEFTRKVRTWVLGQFGIFWETRVYFMPICHVKQVERHEDGSRGQPKAISQEGPLRTG